MLRLVALTICTCLASTSLPSLSFAMAPAEDDEVSPTETKAMEAYEGGKAAYDAGEYAKALELFLDAQSLYPSPVFHFNIGLCQEALENWEQAVISYEAYLRSYQNAFGEDPEDKVNTENKIKRIRKLMELEAQAAEEADEPKEPIEPTEPVAPPEPVDEGPANPGRSLVIAGAALTGLGVAVAGIGGAVFGVQAGDASSQLDAVYTGGNPDRLTLEQATALDQQGRSAQLNQIIMLGAGGAVAITGIALIAVGVSKKNKANAASDSSGDATATLVPSFGPGGAGLVLHGRF